MKCWGNYKKTLLFAVLGILMSQSAWAMDVMDDVSVVKHWYTQPFIGCLVVLLLIFVLVWCNDSKHHDGQKEGRFKV
ncbi:hypothetical protein FW774_12620 [Pedobacter sp. BS3]|nr:hypothetical protein FW774_12620 [Pedobacter sp. BS3]